jgi:hypothetical protein
MVGRAHNPRGVAADSSEVEMSLLSASHRPVVVLGFTALLAVGCGDGGPPVDIHPVSGKVLLAGGKPLDSGTIYFEPVNAPALKASGKIQPDGTFTLTTRKEGDGAAEGDSNVYILPAEAGATTKGASRLAREFMDPESSGITVTVKPGANTLEPIVLKPQARPQAKRTMDR